jgi:hypothetical protein
MSEPVYILNTGFSPGGFTRSKEIAIWWASQHEGRNWIEVTEMEFSEKEATQIVKDVIHNHNRNRNYEN